MTVLNGSELISYIIKKHLLSYFPVLGEMKCCSAFDGSRLPVKSVDCLWISVFVCREQALLTARYSPVLGRHRDYERIRYPHVYDSYAEAIMTSAFVGGAKVKAHTRCSH